MLSPRLRSVTNRRIAPRLIDPTLAQSNETGGSVSEETRSRIADQTRGREAGGKQELSTPKAPTTPKPLDLGAFLSVVTLFPFIFGLVYSHFYFQRLGFPVESLDLSTAFFLLRSFDPIMFALIMLLEFGWIFIPVSFWQRLPIFQRASEARLGWRLLIFIVIPLGVSYFASLWLMHQFGFEAFSTGDLNDWLLIVLVFATVALYLWMKFIRLGRPPGEDDVLDWRHSEALFRAARLLAILGLLLYAVASGIGFGRWEAERLIEGRSPKSTLITLTMRDTPTQPEDPKILIVYMQGLYYVTPMIDPAPAHPQIEVYNGADVLSIVMSSPNEPALP